MPLNLSTFTAWYGMKAGELVAEEVFSELFKPTGDTALVAAEGLGKVSGRGNGHLPSAPLSVLKEERDLGQGQGEMKGGKTDLTLHSRALNC